MGTYLPASEADGPEASMAQASSRPETLAEALGQVPPRADAGENAPHDHSRRDPSATSGLTDAVRDVEPNQLGDDVVVFDRASHELLVDESPTDGGFTALTADPLPRTLFDLFSDEAHVDLVEAIARSEVTAAARVSVRSRLGRSMLVTVIDCGPETGRAMAVIHDDRVPLDQLTTPVALRIRCTRSGRVLVTRAPAGILRRIEQSTSFAEELFDPDDRAAYRTAVARVIDGEPYERLELRGCAPGLAFEAIIATSRQAIVVDLFDRSDDRQAHQALIRSQRQFNQLSATLPVGVFSVRVDGRMSYHSERLREMFGPRIASEYRWIEVVHNDDRHLLSEALAELPTQHDFTTEVRAHRADGTLGWFRISGSGISSRAGVLQAVVGFVEDISERHDLRERIEFQAAFDSLTELPNRATLIDQLHASIEDEGPWRTTVLFIDLDGFKLVNDTQGHNVGDDVLVEVARRFRRAVRADDVIGRFGGDEFLVVASGMTDVHQAEMLAERIHAALSTPVDVDGRAITINASIGIAVSEGDATSEQLIGDADIAMYEAKSAGPSRTVVFDAPLRARASERFDMSADLRHARRRRQLRLEYQPIVDLQTGKVIGAEGLIRWDHPAMGRIEPSTFVPLAEEMGLIADIGDWVVDEACADFDRLRATGHIDDEFIVSINASAHQFSDPDLLVNTSVAALDRHGLQASNLRFELTESVPLTQLPDVAMRIQRLTDRGFGLAIDDFGTGYSSLGYLTALPFDMLKLDLSLVAQIEPDSPAMAIIDSLTRMARTMGFTIVAEGIETDRQRRLLADAGVELGQGYHISRPVPLAGLTALLDHS